MTTTTAAAIEARVTVATIRTWCRRGVIAATKTAGRWVINAASLARRIAIGAMRTRKQANVLDLAATYTTPLVGYDEPLTIAVKVRQRTRPTGETLTSITGLPALLADRLDAITDEGNRQHAITVLHRAVIVICDQADPEWDGDPLARHSGQVRTTYRGGLPVASIDDILDLAEQIRAQLAA